MDTGGTVGRGGNHRCYHQPAVDQHKQFNPPGTPGRVLELPASTGVVPLDGGILQLGISRRKNVSRRIASGSKLLAVPSKCAVRDGVELLVLAASSPVANVASKGPAKDAKY